MLQTKATRTDQVAACRRAECDDQAKLFHFHCTQRLVGLPVSVESPTTHTDTHTYSWLCVSNSATQSLTRWPTVCWDEW